VREQFDSAARFYITDIRADTTLYNLPWSSKAAIAMHQHDPWVSHIPCFNAPDPGERVGFITAIAERLRMLVTGPLELITQEGHAAREWGTGGRCKHASIPLPPPPQTRCTW